MTSHNITAVSAPFWYLTCPLMVVCDSVIVWRYVEVWMLAYVIACYGVTLLHRITEEARLLIQLDPFTAGCASSHI